MTLSNICRRVFDASLPSGAIWRIAPGGDLDKFYRGTADNFEVQRQKAAAIQWLRNALQTTALSDLEIEFGVIPDEGLTDGERRAYLRALMGARCVLPSWVNLENKLRAAGFDVRVYPNDPPVDPATIFSLHPEAYYLVNGMVLDYQERDYNTTVNDDDGTEPVDERGTTICDDDGTEALDERGATVGSFEGMLRYPYEYQHSTRYRWPKVFWIAASRTAGKFDDWNMEYSTLSAWTATGNVIKDGDCEAVGVANWTASNATLTKETVAPYEGTRWLKVLVIPAGSPTYSRSIQNVLTIGHQYRVDAVAHGDGAGTFPRIYHNGTTILWGGVTSTDWQTATETFTAVATDISFGTRLNAPAGTEFVGFDDIVLTDLTPGAAANLNKSLAWKLSGIRSLEVMATADTADPIGPYAEGMLETIVPACHAVTVQAMSSAAVKAALVVCDKDGVWDTAGIEESADGSTGEQLKYVCANGVSGVRLYLKDGAAHYVVGDYARFDDVLIDFSIGAPEFVAASISDQWRSKFEKLVLRYKPVSTWAGVLIDWTHVVPVPGPQDEDDA